MSQTEQVLASQVRIALDKGLTYGSVIDHLIAISAPLQPDQVRAYVEGQYAAAEAQRKATETEMDERLRTDLAEMEEAAKRHPIHAELESITNPVKRLSRLERYGFPVTSAHLQRPESAEPAIALYLETPEFLTRYEEVQQAKRDRQKALARRIVTNDTALHALTESALDALRLANIPPRIFIRSGEIVRVGADEDGRPIIDRIDEYAVRYEVDRAATWIRKMKYDEIAIPPPMDVIKDLMRSPSAALKFPALKGVIETPTMKPNGSILDTPGYDLETGLFYSPAPGLEIPPLPDAPTEAHVRQAAALLRETICDFPFVDDASRANTIATMITPVIRTMIEGPVPLALFDKPAAGTGASLLAEVVAEVVQGRDAAMLPAPEDEGEWRKRILSQLMAGRSVVVIDNIETRLQSAALALLLTSRTYEDRALGRNEMITLPHRTAWIATGINLELGGDIPRRCYWIRMDAHSARPWQRSQTYTHPDLKAWVREVRGSIIAAILILARAWVQAGRPVPEALPVVGGFETWARTVGGILDLAGIPGFLENLESMYEEADSDGPQWAAFMARWFELWGESPQTVAGIVQFLRDENGTTNLDDQLMSVVPDDIMEAWSRNGSGFANKLGHALRRRAGKIFPNGYRLVKGGIAHRAVQWSVEQVPL